MTSPDFKTPEKTKSLEKREKLAEEIKNLLTRENFTLTQEETDNLMKQIKSNKRFICVVGCREENGQRVERFLKIPVDDNPDIYESFSRQIEAARFIKTTQIKTRGVIKANTDPEKGILFAIMETFKEGEAKIGFIAGTEDMELLGVGHAKSCVDTLEALQQTDVYKMSPELQEILQDISGKYDDFLGDIAANLNEEIKPKDMPEDKESELWHEVLNRRLGVKNFREKALKLVEYWQKIIKDQEDQGNFLLHGDLSPSNLYAYDNGDVEFLDWEWAGKCSNKIIANVIDFGNLRARAWNNKEFREKLDRAMIEIYKEKGQEEVGRAIVSLGILRSHMGLAGCFENYDLEKQIREEETRRRESTENDIKKAWEIANKLNELYA